MESIKEIMVETEAEKINIDAHPWIRYFARTIDMLLFHMIITIIMFISPIRSVYFEISPICISIIIAMLWVFGETLIMSLTGKTLGKYILNISLLNKQGNRLTVRESFKRSVSVWIFGLGLNIPIISLLTPIFSYDRLKERHMTRWDEDNEINIIHEHVGGLRILMVVIIHILAYFVICYLAYKRFM